MSRKAASDFMGQLARDSALREELAAAVAGTADPSEVVSRMVGFAARHGYEVQPEELADAGALPLSDEQLSQVSGGAETVHLYLRRR